MPEHCYLIPTIDWDDPRCGIAGTVFLKFEDAVNVLHSQNERLYGRHEPVLEWNPHHGETFRQWKLYEDVIVECERR